MDAERAAEQGSGCICRFYVVDYSDPERYHQENVDREDDPACPVHGVAPPGSGSTEGGLPEPDLETLHRAGLQLPEYCYPTAMEHAVRIVRAIASIRSDAYAEGVAAGRAEMHREAVEAIRLALLPDTAERLIALISGDK